jgi:hypothetical protein
MSNYLLMDLKRRTNMGREVRMVPANWQHPIKFKKGGGIHFVHLLGRDFESCALEWDIENEKWNRGEFPSYADENDKKLTYSEWDGERPKQEDYMPIFTEGTATYYMMYENTSEGTPISPAFETPEELAKWLVDNNTSSFTYEGWLRVVKGGYSPSFVIPNSCMTNGVDAF